VWEKVCRYRMQDIIYYRKMGFSVMTAKFLTFQLVPAVINKREVVKLSYWSHPSWIYDVHNRKNTLLSTVFPGSRSNRWFIILWGYLVLSVRTSVNHRKFVRTVALTQTKFLGYCPSLTFTFRPTPCPTLLVFGESTLKKLLKVNAKRYGHSQSIGGAILCNKIGYSLGGLFHYPFIWKSEETLRTILYSLTVMR
jgi:hypothetical protein